MKLRYTPEAIRDLTGIRRYIADNLSNPKSAEKIVQKIMRNCSRLKHFPMSGFSLGVRTGQDTDIRVLVCENYLALYKLEDGFVSVARVVNGRQDYITELFGREITSNPAIDAMEQFQQDMLGEAEKAGIALDDDAVMVEDVRGELAKSLFGVIPSDVTLEEARDERLDKI